MLASTASKVDFCPTVILVNSTEIQREGRRESEKMNEYARKKGIHGNECLYWMYALA